MHVTSPVILQKTSHSKLLPKGKTSEISPIKSTITSFSKTLPTSPSPKYGIFEALNDTLFETNILKFYLLGGETLTDFFRTFLNNDQLVNTLETLKTENEKYNIVVKQFKEWHRRHPDYPDFLLFLSDNDKMIEYYSSAQINMFFTLFARQWAPKQEFYKMMDEQMRSYIETLGTPITFDNYHLRIYQEKQLSLRIYQEKQLSEGHNLYANLFNQISKFFFSEE
jgi:hypothetical protein